MALELVRGPNRIQIELGTRIHGTMKEDAVVVLLGQFMVVQLDPPAANSDVF